MSINRTISRSTASSLTTLHVSCIDVSLARDSRKTINSVSLAKTGQSLGDVRKSIRSGEVHREEFRPPLAIDPDDHIIVSVNCSSQWRKQMDVPIDIHLQDIECMREEQGIRSYRKRVRNIEVVVTAHQSLPATTTRIIEICSRFRLLIIGNSGVGKSSLIRKVFGVEDVYASDNVRGDADIDQEFVSPANERFVVHDSLGFEAGEEKNIEIVKQFVARRQAMPQLKDQLHAIWLCIETPYCGGRLLEAGVGDFLQNKDEILGDIPLVVVLTKVDLLDMQLELELSENETLEHSKSSYMDQHCIKPLYDAAGSDISHVAVSSEEGYSGSLTDLVKATDEAMAKYHVSEVPRAIASIAQRVSIKEKIELSLSVGRKKYWKMLLKSAVFRGHTLKECLQVIHKDIVTVWNFSDPDKCLLDEKVIAALFRTGNPGELGDTQASMTSFAGLLTSGIELAKALSGSGDTTLGVLAPIAGVVIYVAKTTYETYQEAKKDVKHLMAYIVNLVCLMQAIFLLASASRITEEMINFALQAYERPKRFVDMSVDGFDGNLGVLPGGRDHVLERIEELIWRYSIKDHEIEELKQRIGQIVTSGPS